MQLIGIHEALSKIIQISFIKLNFLPDFLLVPLTHLSQFQDKLIELQHYSKQAKEEVVNCRKEVVQLEEKLKEKAAEIQRLAKEVNK